MKKTIFTTALIALAVAVGWQPAEAQVKLPPASSAQTVTQGLGISTVTLKYSRPNKNDRKVFGALVPYDEVWRTGANGIPIVTFDGPVTIAGSQVEAGTYGLLTIPGKKNWTIILSKNSEQWGAYTYKQEEDLLRFDVKAERLAKPLETFTISFSDVHPKGARLNIAWERTTVGFDLVVDQDAEITASIAEAMKGDKKPYFQAAQYYYKNDKDIQQALEWVNEADKAPNPAPYIKYWKALIQLKAGDKAGAIATATEGVEIAKQQNNEEYVKLNGQVIAKAKK
ncbi:DUF2911 domain-containing protein [Parapedobacter sp. 10938]|uniref:DUF2911 domain-containing protein n=1 Tax=Parapedobacter flavus TaxID=3110225 RepID=UPI002DBE2484|nr:DUF2911 domain-containing protein [Parapedobacter sp. 10938]MEC3879272.1 DUF2911 domain-containing protein [Parapedobacter sp. 10938]